jgi:hypothetical protein
MVYREKGHHATNFLQLSQAARVVILGRNLGDEQAPILADQSTPPPPWTEFYGVIGVEKPSLWLKKAVSAGREPCARPLGDASGQANCYPQGNFGY